MANPVATLGEQSVAFVVGLGRIALFSAEVGRAIVRPPARLRQTLDSIYDIGFLSLPLIMMSGAVIGGVLGYQGFRTLGQFGAEQSLGVFVGLTTIRELGPVLTGLLVTGRAGSSTAAEIGTMVASQQLDGLRMMSVNPIHFVVLPRAIAMTVCIPLLNGIFIVCAIFGGYVIGVELMGVDPGSYMSTLEGSVDFREDVLHSIVKSIAFGVLVGLVATYRGYSSEPHSAGVSRATTSTVVTASVWILILDYFITLLWGV